MDLKVTNSAGSTTHFEQPPPSTKRQRKHCDHHPPRRDREVAFCFDKQDRLTGSGLAGFTETVTSKFSIDGWVTHL
jgi:hypothetical protein